MCRIWKGVMRMRKRSLVSQQREVICRYHQRIDEGCPTQRAEKKSTFIKEQWQVGSGINETCLGPWENAVCMLSIERDLGRLTGDILQIAAESFKETTGVGADVVRPRVCFGSEFLACSENGGETVN